MQPADNVRAEHSHPNLVPSDGPLYTRISPTLCPSRRLALRQMRQCKPADSLLPNVMEGCDIGGIGEAEVQGREHGDMIAQLVDHSGRAAAPPILVEIKLQARRTVHTLKIVILVWNSPWFSGHYAKPVDFPLFLEQPRTSKCRRCVRSVSRCRRRRVSKAAN